MCRAIRPLIVAAALLGALLAPSVAHGGGIAGFIILPPFSPPGGWGANDAGQVGDGSTSERHAPVSATTAGSYAELAAGNNHSIALLASGGFQAWGDNTYGELGMGTHDTSPHPNPTIVSSAPTFNDIVAGGRHNLARLRDSLGNYSVWAWGDNRRGQLGDGSTNESDAPEQIAPSSVLSTASAIAAGDSHSLYVLNGLLGTTLYSFGDNTYGQLGQGGHDSSPHPNPSAIMTGVTAIAAGARHSLALKSDGSVWAWGDNSRGQLGDGSTNESDSPEQVISASIGAAAIVAGDYFSAALKNDGTVLVWGDNTTGELGLGSPDAAPHPVPTQVPGLTGVTQIASGGGHILAEGTDTLVLGASSSSVTGVWAWGDNSRGQLGDGTTVERDAPTLISAYDPNQGLLLAAGQNHSLSVPALSTVTIAPLSQTRGAGTTATVVATTRNAGAAPSANTTVTFIVTSGPDAGKTGTAPTDGSGNAQFSYVGAAPGTDTVVAQFTDSLKQTQTSTAAIVTWLDCAQTMPTFPSKSVTNGILDVKQQDVNGYLSNDYTGTTNMAAGYPNNNAFPGDTATFDNYFKKQNTGSSSTVVIKAKDQAGCTNQFDPLLTSTARDAGKPMTDTFSGILKNESQLQIVNGTPGLNHLVVTINGTSYRVDALKDNEQRLLNIGAALHDGSNSMSVTSYGRPGGSAALIAGPPQS